mmetsp:Transcript_41683/g.110078  ORF Transcript_41683/g.110078 Transcript_41683/m.110078 type:complete len:645 (-) Transcript_41683:222-2156(-)
MDEEEQASEPVPLLASGAPPREADARRPRCSRAPIGLALALALVATLAAALNLTAEKQERGLVKGLTRRPWSRPDVVQLDILLGPEHEDVICQAQPVYDFWVKTSHTLHFGDPFAGEVRGGLQFYAFPLRVEGTAPVWSFWNERGLEHTYHMGNEWPGEVKEKVIFYAYPLGANVSLSPTFDRSLLVSAFWSKWSSAHTFHLGWPWEAEEQRDPQFYAYSQEAIGQAGCRDDSLLVPVVGVNLGGWLLLEDWMWAAEMESKKIPDEWTLIRKHGGPDDAKAVALIKNHWDTFVTEQDLDRLKAFGVTHVRVPIGYWLVDYDKRDGFIDGGQEYLHRLLMWLKTRDMKAMLDLHALPGGQAVGQSFTGKKTDMGMFFLSTKHFNRGKRAMTRLAELILSYDTDWRTAGVVWGMELVNEPDWRYWDTSPGIRELYEEMVPSLRRMLPAGRYYLFLNFQEYPRRTVSTRWLAKMVEKDPDSFAGVVYDFHEYHSFGDDNQEKGSYHADMDSCKTCCRDPLLLNPLVKAKLKMAACEYSLTTGYAGNKGFFEDFMHNQLSLWRSTPGMVGSFFWNHRILTGPNGYYREFSLLDLLAPHGPLPPVSSMALVPRCPNSDLSKCPVYDEDTVAWNSECWWRPSKYDVVYQR